MANTTVLTLSRDRLTPTGRERRNSYFEMLSSISSDLNFVASDLKKAQFQFKASAPKSPLAVSASVPTSPQDEKLLHLQVDRYQHLKVSRNYSVGTNNNASTVSTMPAMQYAQPPSTGLTRDPICTSALYDKSVQSLILPTSPVLQPLTIQETFTNPHRHPGRHGDDSMELSLLTRLVHTKPVWFLPHTPRAAAIHYLQGQPVGTFVVCQSRDKDNLVLTMKHPGTGTGLYIEKLPIHITQTGVKLSSTSEEFPTIEDLILHHLHHGGALPCKLTLPPEIMSACNIRALQSLALFEEEFWTRKQSRQDPSAKQGECSKDNPRKSPRGLQNILQYSTEPQKHSPPIPAIFTPALAPCLPSPKGYIVMNKQPVGPTTAAKTHLVSSEMKSLTQGVSQVSLRNIKDSSSIAQNRQLLKSCSFDDKSNPFRQSESTNLDRQLESTDDTLLASSGRQPMRCSTQSQQEFVLKNLSHYPPPLHSPPPPPKEISSTHLTSSLECSISPPVGYRGSTEYYTPFEVTRQGHQPPSVFGLESLFSSSMPPPLSPKGTTMTPPGTQYQQPNQGILPGLQSSQYSTPNIIPKPVVTLDSLQQPFSTETKQVQSHKPIVASSGGQFNLDAVLQPSVSVAPSQADANPLFEFDPLLATKPSYLPSSPPSQDVFSSAPSQPAPSIPKHTTNVGNLLNLSSDGSEEEEQEIGEFQFGEKIEMTEGSSEDWDQSCDDDEEEEEYEERSIMDQSKYSPLRDEQSNESYHHTGDMQEEDKIKMSDLNESNLDKLSEISMSQTKKMKKLKKKKMSSLSRIQKYVLRGKSKKKTKMRDPTEEIQAAIHKLASNKSSYFSMMMECFVQNIKDRDELERPDILIRNLRQFMSGMKNYLFNRREPEIDAAMDKYYNLTMAELDAIVEGAIYEYILLPLKPEIYKCFIINHKESGALDVLDHNIQLARAKTPAELGIKRNYIPPEGEDLARIRQHFNLLEKTYSPIKKLEYLLDIVRTVYDTVVDQNSSRGQAVQSMGADDFLPMFIYVLVQCEVVDIEIEANYMWGLLEPSMLSGEGGYYLTTLSSAICVLKQFEQETQNTETETKGFLSVMVAVGDKDDSVLHKTLPVLPGMNAVDVSRILAHKLRIDNAHQYQLYLLSRGQEMAIPDNECPLELKEKSGQQRACFGYKKEDHQVQWPFS